MYFPKLMVILILFLGTVGGNFPESLSSEKSIFDLLSEEGISNVALQTNFKSLLKSSDQEKPKYQTGRLSFQDKNGKAFQWDIEIRLRGKRRKIYCNFPPFKIRFSRSALASAGLNPDYHTIKFVSHCKKGERSQDILFREQLVYQMYNILTEKSYRTSLLEINYIGSGGKIDRLKSYSFMIENSRQMAERLDGFIFDEKKFRLSNTLNEVTSLQDVFQYMIGNTDYKIDGLHNVDLVQLKNSSVMLAIPYDFDYSALVNAPYSVPSPWAGTQEISQRVFLGFCESSNIWEKVLTDFHDHKDEIYALIHESPHLQARSKREMKEYLDEFYSLIKSPVKTKNVFHRTCF